jgi:malonyl-CoA/methylmalonyl-CoA synthetase
MNLLSYSINRSYRLSHLFATARFQSTITRSPLLSRIGQKKWGDSIAIIDDHTGTSLTYHQLDIYSKVLAAEIEKKDKGSRKSIGAFNKPGLMYTLTMLATWQLNRTFVPLCTTHSANEVNYVLQDSNVGIIICDKKEELSKDLLAHITEFPPILETSQITFHEHEYQLILPLNPLNEEAVVIYTSGTTGRPKGVLHTHTNLQYMMLSLTEAWQYTSTDKILHFLPLYHVHGMMNKLLCMLWVGGTIEFVPTAQAHDLWGRLASEQTTMNHHHSYKPLTLFMAVPTVYAKMLEYVPKLSESTKLSALQTLQQLRLMVCGSAALPDIIMEAWYTLTGQRLLERYGMTEIGMALSNPYQPMETRKPGYVGYPLPYVECRLVDDHGQVISKPYTPGELQVAGPCVFTKYLNNIQATESSFIDGKWFKTGDISERTETGMYKILGRNSADIIKSSGYKISALEIERELLSYPQVSEVAVVAIPDAILGEKIVAVVVRRSSSDTTSTFISSSSSSSSSSLEKDLQEYLDTKLAKYKQPKKYYFVETIPRNHMGKVK